MGDATRVRREGIDNMPRTISHQCLWLFLLIIVTSVLLVQRSVSSVASEPVWQTAMAPVVRLGVQDKYGSLGKFTEVWIVSALGKQYQAKATVERDNLKYTYFPDDFNTYSKPGRYSWKCFVGGRKVADGSFEFKTVVTYSDQLTVHQISHR